MKQSFRLARPLWISAVILFIAVILVPVSTRMSRAGGLVLFLIVWFGLIAMCWRRRALRISLFAITVLIAGFLVLPSRHRPDPDSLRADYLAGLRRYEGCRYYWGGENPLGIDCSGLVRRGLIDALFWRGLRTADSGQVRQALTLWWNDCTAESLGNEFTNTSPVLRTSAINKLDHTPLLPGDLAVTGGGVHVMAYLGDRTWIEADPSVGKVITATAPSKENLWFDGPMNIVRWKCLEPAKP